MSFRDAVLKLHKTQDQPPRDPDVLQEPVTVVDNALVLPQRTPGTRQSAPLVVDAAGSPVVDALNYNRTVPLPMHWQDRSQFPAAQHQPGTWLYGGLAFQHFGHFLFESTSRLWPVDALRDVLKGIVFVNLRTTNGMTGVVTQILDKLDVGLPLLFLDTPTTFERLYVPRQGSGMGPLAAGTPAFRAFVREKLCRIPPRDGVGKIYLTRERYYYRRGGVFAETHLRGLLEEAGYTAFSPEAHSLEEQVATYRGASHIVGPDSSAFHLVAYVAAPETKVAILLRRHRGAIDLLPQLAGHMGRSPLVIDAISTVLQRENFRNLTWARFAELDLTALFFTLRKHGFIRNVQRWNNLSETDRSDLLASYEAKLGSQLKVVWKRGDGPLSSSSSDMD